jgi:uncharacterized protein YjiS (DUF1127 family)
MRPAVLRAEAALFAAAGAVPGALAALTGRLRAWRRVAAERRALSRLDDRLLRDIGLDRASAEAEAARPFWDPPAGR